MAETVTLPRYLVIVILGAVLPAIFTLLFVLAGFLWSVSNQITRIDQRGIDQDRTIKELTTQTRLNDERYREQQVEFANFRGWASGRAGLPYQAVHPQQQAPPPNPDQVRE